jgi:hypothetical protein
MKEMLRRGAPVVVALEATLSYTAPGVRPAGELPECCRYPARRTQKSSFQADDSRDPGSEHWSHDHARLPSLWGAAIRGGVVCRSTALRGVRPARELRARASCGDKSRRTMSLREATRAVRHLAAWASYHSGGRIEPRRSAAHLTYYTSAGAARALDSPRRVLERSARR